MSAKALDRSSQTTKTEYCQPDRYRGLQRFPVQQKATKRWAEPRTRLITYAQAARLIFACILGDPGDPAVWLLHMPPKLQPNFQTPRNCGGIEHMQTVCTYQALFSLPVHESQRTRLVRGIPVALAFYQPCSQATAKLFVTYRMINNGRYCLVYHMM